MARRIRANPDITGDLLLVGGGALLFIYVKSQLDRIGNPSINPNINFSIGNPFAGLFPNGGIPSASGLNIVPNVNLGATGAFLNTPVSAVSAQASSGATNGFSQSLYTAGNSIKNAWDSLWHIRPTQVSAPFGTNPATVDTPFQTTYGAGTR